MKRAFTMNSAWGKYRSAVPFAQAFSLVEVTLALGIVAFAMLGIVGVIPAGLGAAQQATRQTAESHILMQINSELSRLPFSEIQSYATQAIYCDYDGRKLDHQEGSIFTATLQILPPIYPNAEKLTGIEERFDRVVVTIRRTGETPAQGRRASFTIVNSGH